jgi:putative SOS response-associated peptidase YedK
MCGRMTLTRSGSEISDYFALEMAKDAVAELNGAPLRPRYNIAPSQQIATIAPGTGASRSFSWRKWGLVPSWSMDPAIGSRLFNARSETADEKPSFRTAWRRRRCLVVADGFYEWKSRGRGRQPYHFRPREGTLLALAGLFELWNGKEGEVIESCTILTTEANADLEGVHHRMPVILDRACFDVWLDPVSDSSMLKAMMCPAADGSLDRFEVSRRVNNARFDDRRCLAPESKSVPQEKPLPNVVQGELFGPDGDHTK